MILKAFNEGHNISFYKKPPYKHGWRNYQVNLLKPEITIPVFRYTVNHQYDNCQFNIGFKSLFLVGVELELDLGLIFRSKATKWVSKNFGKDFIVSINGCFVANGFITRNSGIVLGYHENKVSLQLRAEQKRVFYIPKTKQVLLPHESIKYDT